MKKLLPVVALLCVAGCKVLDPTYLTPLEKQGIDRALSQPTFVETNTAILTTSTKFAGKCPYDGTISLSTSCLPSGSTTASGTNVTSWSINFQCPTCLMYFSDTRTQTIGDVKSIQLPIRNP